MTAPYDAAASDDYHNAPDAEIRVPFFGSVRDLRNLSWSARTSPTWMCRLERVGYRDGETLFVAPYDFRYAVAPPGHPSGSATPSSPTSRGWWSRRRRSRHGARAPWLPLHQSGSSVGNWSSEGLCNGDLGYGE
ncbi:hypothetical protein C2845_PM15G17100 [Panicum miliaceum]|uniref:Uncharacterized protein n=1 Tax=Panicum miliaceum TaxID=4540 RepID=A0A3L6QCB2_PANMI|nr:hypothetical protein C2845_PM15G17100 [Panicum miliaceum]